jgi:hypothetical protein
MSLSYLDKIEQTKPVARKKGAHVFSPFYLQKKYLKRTKDTTDNHTTGKNTQTLKTPKDSGE